MARRKAKLDLTLFPFLSVLSGLIAVNVLMMIVTISTRVMTSEPEPPPPESAEGGEAASDAEVVPSGIDADSYARLEKQIKALELSLAQRRAERETIRLALRNVSSLLMAKELELERAKPWNVPKTGERIGEPVPKKIIPRKDSNGVLKTPIVIEVNSAGYTVHPKKTFFPFDPPKDPKAAEIPEGLKTVLKEIEKDGKNRYPLLLIHPNGAEAFTNLGNYILNKHKDMSLGWEPFSREWLVDSNEK